MAEINVENVVASATLGESFDLDEVHEILETSEYDPEKFRGVIYRVRDRGLKTSVLIFRSGKMVCTGATKVEQIHRTVAYLKEVLSEEDQAVLDEPEVTVQNIVATTDLGHPLNLNSVAISLGLERIEYEPEQFPGLVYRMDEPRLVMLFFGSGKVVCTGGKKIEDIRKGIEKISLELIRTGFLPEKNE
ncbi:MAG: TATA-box-binding protein [Thermoplasmata archaeon]